jgi:hypothetical protein
VVDRSQALVVLCGFLNSIPRSCMCCVHAHVQGMRAIAAWMLLGTCMFPSRLLQPLVAYCGQRWPGARFGCDGSLCCGAAAVASSCSEISSCNKA